MRVDPSENKTLVREYHLEMGLVQVYNDYIVTIFEEGTILTLEKAYQIIGISEIHFRNKKFGHISLRSHSYAIDPIVYKYFREMENLKAFAVVSAKEIDLRNFDIEKIFYKNPMKFFIEYANALAWVKKRVSAP